MVQQDSRERATGRDSWVGKAPTPRSLRSLATATATHRLLALRRLVSLSLRPCRVCSFGGASSSSLALLVRLPFCSGSARGSRAGALLLLRVGRSVALLLRSRPTRVSCVVVACAPPFSRVAPPATPWPTRATLATLSTAAMCSSSTSLPT